MRSLYPAGIVLCLHIMHVFGYSMGWQPQPRQDAVVSWPVAGDEFEYRVTVISDAVFRVELINSGSDGDDRPTLRVKNRDLGSTPTYTTTPDGNGAITVSTSQASIRIDGSKPIPSSCAKTTDGMDQVGGQRVPAYPQGLPNVSLPQCCAACDNTTGCTTFVWASDSEMCYLMKGVQSTVSASNRTLGSRIPIGSASGGTCLPAGSVSATFQLVAGPPLPPANWTGKWTDASSAAGNLGGVWEKLDCYSNPSECFDTYVTGEHSGILSTDGWAVLDETTTARLSGTQSDDGVFGPWWAVTSTDPPVAATTDVCDVLVLLEGRDFVSAARDWQEVSGPIQLLDEEMYDVWWSRHDPWNASQLHDLLQGYADNNLPMRSISIDMQWHTLGYMDNPPDVNGPGDTCTIDDDDGLPVVLNHGPLPRNRLDSSRNSSRSGTELVTELAVGDTKCKGWGGFDWNTTAYPNPKDFVDSYFHSPTGNPIKNPINVLLNVHPQDGIDHCQAKYAEFAAFTGVDPASNETVTMDNGNHTLMLKFFSDYLGADPLSSVDAWWTDYYGSMGPTDPRQSSSQLLWSNYMYGTSQLVQRGRRPMVLTRRGGLGDHAFSPAFSGDVFQSWDTLAYEVNFTARAASGALQSWSHDIGGFHRFGRTAGACVRGDGNVTDPLAAELYMRWIQAAVFWPHMRTHCRFCERRVWMFTGFADAMGDAFRVRHAMVPHLYSAIATAAETSAPYPIRSLFVDYPEEPLAMQFADRQFIYCDNVTVAPIARPGLVSTDGDEFTGISGAITASASNGAAPLAMTQQLFVPPGEWVTWEAARAFKGPSTATLELSSVTSLPALVRGGSVVFTRPWNASSAGPMVKRPLTAVVFPSSEWMSTPGASHDRAADGVLRVDSRRVELYEDDGKSAPASGTVGAPLRSRQLAGGFRASCRTPVEYEVVRAAETGRVSIRGTVGPSIGAACSPVGTTRAVRVELRGAGIQDGPLGQARGLLGRAEPADGLCPSCRPGGTVLLLDAEADTSAPGGIKFEMPLS